LITVTRAVCLQMICGGLSAINRCFYYLVGEISLWGVSMKDSYFSAKVFGCEKPVIGMVHLPPLPGAHRHTTMSVEDVIEFALRDAAALSGGGVDGLQVENISDKPFIKPGSIGFEASNMVAAVAREVKHSFGLPVGVFVLANGVAESVSAALASGASWIRVNMFNLAYVADEGFIEAGAGIAERLKNYLGPKIALLVDVLAKHGSHQIVSDLPFEYHVRRAEELGAEAVVVSGTRTGRAVPAEKVAEAKHVAAKPVFVGSGVDAANVERLLSIADGAIVGTYFKRGGFLSNPVDVDRVRQLMDVVKRLRSRI